MNAHEILQLFYKPGTKAYEILIRHGELVGRKALVVADHVSDLQPDRKFIAEAALLHDIGIFLTAAPSIGCHGSHPYICHGYLGREILSPDQERLWITARSMAEALKAETFLFRAGATPYDGPEPAVKLLDRLKELRNMVEELHSVTISPEERRKRLPEGPLSVEEYITERVDEQVNGFYRDRVQQYDRLMKNWRNFNLALGAVATVLGVLGKWTGAWVAVITTITTSVAAYLYANRYQYLIISYQKTAQQLNDLKQAWKAKGAPDQDPEERNRFILECEEAISIENSAWMAKLTEKPKS